MNASNSKELRQLRALAHPLRPVVTVASNGLSDAVLQELERALSDHELIKVKFNVGDRDVRATLIQELCEATNAELIQTIGKIALILRFAKERNERLSNLLK